MPPLNDRWQDLIRPDRNAYYLGVAQAVSLRGDCRRRQVGAVIVMHDRIRAAGYNGTKDRGMPGCMEGACPRGMLSVEECPAYSDYSNCIAEHAEMSALYDFQRIMVAFGASAFKRNWIGSLYSDVHWRQENPPILMYVSAEPCHRCKDELLWIGMPWRVA